MNTLKQLLIRALDLAKDKETSDTKASPFFMMPAMNTVPLEVPACWRRSSQIRIDNRRHLKRG